MDAAIIHIIGDSLLSLAVIIAAIIIVIEPKYGMADPICTFIFSIVVIAVTWSVTKVLFLINNINIIKFDIIIFQYFKKNYIGLYLNTYGSCAH